MFSIVKLRPIETCATAGNVTEFTSASPGSYMHLEICQSLMLTAKATLGQRSAPGGTG